MDKVKCGYSSLIIYLFLLVAPLILGACDSKSIVTNSKDEINKLEERAHLLEGDNSKEINYLFYNEASGEKHITFSFHGNYTDTNFGKIELLQDEKIVSNRVLLRDKTINNNGQFIITLPEYVEKFNRVRFFDESNNTICTLKVGQYMLEKINIPANVPTEKRWTLDNYVTTENANKYEIELRFVQEQATDSYKYEVTVPRELAKQKILEDKVDEKVTGHSLDVTYSSQIDLSHFKKNDYVNIAYDLLIVQKDELEEKSYVMANIYIPLAESLSSVE